MPIRVGQAVEDVLSSSRQARPAVTKATVKVYDRAATAKAGIDGLLFSVQRADGVGRTAAVTLQVDYGAFSGAFGGDWSSRLRLTLLPLCAMSTPERQECQQGKALPTTNNVKTSTLTADAPLAGDQMTMLAVQAGPSGDNGDYTATSLSQAGTWSVSAQTGDFAWSYPLRTPPSLGGPAPSLSAGYTSGSVDGRTTTSNNQGGWVGDGWEMWPGFIERKYASCADDNPSHKTGDLCWFNNNATLSMQGHAGELIETGTPNVFRLKKDDGTRVEKLTDAARSNGDNDSEYWKVTTIDGVQYFFGYHKLPNWASGNPVTDSVWTVPVYGNNPGEPCYNATFANAWCPTTPGQAWRWNLDYVLDPHGNTMSYFYGKETGWYGRDNTPSQRTPYVRGGWLDRIEYGTRTGSEYASAAPMRISFDARERCLTGCWTGTAWTSPPVAAEWRDTPLDQDCTAAPCTDKISPTFWSMRRLAKVTTQVRSGPTTYRDVESWTLRHEFLNAGDNEGSPMWLRGITRTGHVTTAEGTVVSDPETVFDSGAEPLPNRVDRQDGRTLLTRFRIKSITNESGGQVGITYSGPDCTKDSLPQPESNTKRCMPVFYSPAGTPTLDWFHKYVVTVVNLDDVTYLQGDGTPAANNPTQTTFYDYLDAPAWHYTDDEITPDKFKTWGNWRGYGRVQVRTGKVGGQQTATEHRYLRGMDGDKQPSGTPRDVWVSGTWGGTVEDHEALTGFVRQVIVLNGPGGAEISSTVNEPWLNGPTATRTRGGVTTNAWKSNTATTRTRTALEAGGYRTDRSVISFNSDGLPVAAEASGDEDIQGDETCTRTAYARNDTTWMIDKVSQTELLSVACDAASTPAAPSSVLSRTRTFYDSYVDDSSFGAAPSVGDVVRTEELDKWIQSTPVYVRTGTKTYDEYGGVRDTIDALGHKTTTAYIIDSATGLLVSNTVTNPLGHVVETVVEPAWQLPTKIIDPNGVLTNITYDGLGRRTNVWLPGRNKASGQTPSLKFSYLMRAGGDPTAVTTESLLPTGNAYRKTIALFDGFLRPRQIQMQATGGGRTITDTLHDPMGGVAWKSAVYYDSTGAAPATTLGGSGEPPSVTRFAYDGAGRKTAEIFLAGGVEKWRTTTAYGGDRVHVTPPRGGTATTTVSDVRGQTVQLRQYKSFADVGSADTTKFDTTSYTHTLARQLKTVTDAAGNNWSYSYDLRGRQSQKIDPDAGTVTFTYDAKGQLSTSTSPSTTGPGTATVAYLYDELGRKASMRDDSITGTIRAEWVHDQTVIMPAGVKTAKGKPTSAIRYSGGNAYMSKIDSYDVYGRATSTSMVLPSAESDLCASAAPNICTYTTAITYRPNGQPSTTTMPAAADLASEKLTFGYTDVGDPSTMYSPLQSYVDSVSYNKIGQLTQTNLGAGSLAVTATRDYDLYTRRLNSLHVVPKNLPEAADYDYTYDDNGDILKISDTPEGQAAQDDHQCFDYDHLRRLTEAWTPVGGDCDAAKAVSGLAGPAPYWHSWTFDAIGNRQTATHHAATNTEFTYSHPASGTGSVRPHTLSQVQATGGQTWNRSYTYDDAGNTKTRPTATGAAQTLTFDREGKMTTLTEGSNTTTVIYDADGNRLIRKDPDGSKTLYLAGTEVRYNQTPNTKTAVRYYGHIGATIAVRTAAGLQWVVGDHHGTASLTINASTLAVAKRRTVPHGEQRGNTSGSWAPGMDKGLVGGTQDPTGLTHIGAREYDPATGRFISIDPIIDFTDPQQLHGYAYGNNAPTVFADPDGRRPFDEDNGRPWYTRQHDTAANAALQVIRSEVKRRGGNPDDVTLEYRVPNGSKKGTGNDGKADIVWDDGETIYIWEVKAVGQGDALAQKDLASYRHELSKSPKYAGKAILPGFPMPYPALGIVPGSPHRGTIVIAFQGPTEGTILYITQNLPRPDAKPETKRVPEPNKQPQPRTVPIDTYAIPQPQPGIPAFNPGILQQPLVTILVFVVMCILWVAYAATQGPVA